MTTTSFKAWCASALIALLILAGCYTVPETGRKSLSLVPDEQVISLALQSFTLMKKEEKISYDPEANYRVRRVGLRIAKAVGDALPSADWEFLVFEDDDMANAFAMPGGKVGIYTGMLRLADTDDALAVVMGHEVAHVIAKHGNERMSQGLLVEMVGSSLDKITDGEDAGTRNLVLTAFGLGANLGYLLPFSRLSEREADQIGLLYSARAGFDPRAAVQFWQDMAQQGGGAPPAFLSTHPNYETRIEGLTELMPRALEEYRKAIGKN